MSKRAERLTGPVRYNRVDPLRGMEVELVTTRRDNPLRVIREAIAIAEGQAALPTHSGQRHYRHPLTDQEREFHEKVDRFLERSRS